MRITVSAITMRLHARGLWMVTYPLLIVVVWFAWFAVRVPFPPVVLVRPFAFALIAAILITLTARALMRQADLAALLAAVTILVFVGGHDDRAVLLGLAAMVILVVVRLVWAWQPPTARTLTILATVGRLARVAIVILVMAVGIRAIQGLGVAPVQAAAPDAQGLSMAGAVGRPDIYILLLDGHPRFDTLRNDFDYDSRPLADAFRDTGFTVTPGSRSNYPGTGLSISSLLDVRHIGDIPAYAGLGSPDAPHIDYMSQAAITDARALRIFQRAGYERVTIASGFTSLTIASADRVIDTGQISDAEIVLLRESILGRLVEHAAGGLLASQFRSRVDDILDAFEAEYRSVTDQPKFVFAHLPSPHGPLMYSFDGHPSMIDLESIHVDRPAWLSDDEWAEAYRTHIRAVDERVSALLRRLDSESRRPAIIIVLSDHGVRANGLLGEDVAGATAKEVGQQYRNLFAWRGPDDLDYVPRPTLVNTLQPILNRYLGLQLPCTSDRLFGRGPTGLIEVADPDAGSIEPGGLADETACRVG
jgi:hypothetical protein